MTWAKSIVGGIILGALISVFPIDLIACPLAPFIAFALLKREKETARRRQFDLRLALSAAIAASVGAIASQLPFKYLDTTTTRPLPAKCTTLARAAKAGMIATRDVPQSLLEREVCFSGVQPSLREVERVADESGLALRIGWCGTGQTLLWGMHPIRMSLTPLVSR